MIVLDASATVDWLLQTTAGRRIENRIYSRYETLHTPHLLDLEVTQVLRRLVRQGVVPAKRADEALGDLLDLRIIRYPHLVLLSRVWQLRHNFSAYSEPLCSRGTVDSLLLWAMPPPLSCFDSTDLCLVKCPRRERGLPERQTPTQKHLRGPSPSSENSKSRYFRLSLLLKIAGLAIFEAENDCAQSR
jgi:predicted nucleic acid-binding protein